MLKKMVLLGSFLSIFSASAHHAKCKHQPDGLIICGAHAGPISFNLLNYGDVNKSTKQVFLCNNKGAQVEELSFRWVESDNEDIHFDMNGLKFNQVSENCALVGGLDFTPHKSFENSKLNAWKLSIKVKGVSVPSTLYVESINPDGE
jgi:hypothetical protein